MMFSSALGKISFRMLLMATMHASLHMDRLVILNYVNFHENMAFHERENSEVC